MQIAIHPDQINYLSFLWFRDIENTDLEHFLFWQSFIWFSLLTLIT